MCIILSASLKFAPESRPDGEGKHARCYATLRAGFSDLLTQKSTHLSTPNDSLPFTSQHFGCSIVLYSIHPRPPDPRYIYGEMRSGVTTGRSRSPGCGVMSSALVPSVSSSWLCCGGPRALCGATRAAGAFSQAAQRTAVHCSLAPFPPLRRLRPRPYYLTRNHRSAYRIHSLCTE